MQIGFQRHGPEALDLSWMSRGACRGSDTSCFYPEKNEPALMAKMRQCREICAGCEVRQECLDYAVKYEPFGFWGGMSEKDRKIYRREIKVSVQEHVFTKVTL